MLTEFLETLPTGLVGALAKREHYACFPHMHVHAAMRHAEHSKMLAPGCGTLCSSARLRPLALPMLASGEAGCPANFTAANVPAAFHMPLSGITSAGIPPAEFPSPWALMPAAYSLHRHGTVTETSQPLLSIHISHQKFFEQQNSQGGIPSRPGRLGGLPEGGSAPV